MKALRDALDKVHPLFAKGGILEAAYPMYEALDTFLYTPGEVASGKTHVRDSIDLKRMMITVVIENKRSARISIACSPREICGKR